MATRTLEALACAAVLASVSCDRARARGSATPEPSCVPSSASPWTPFPAPSLRVATLRQQASLYDVVVREFVRLGWETVCVDAIRDGVAAAQDPPDDVVARVRAGNPSFRPRSACRRDGEDVVDLQSGSRHAVEVTLVGAEKDGEDVLVRVQWCCWTGWGTFRLVFRDGKWSLKQTEGWLQT